MRRRSFHYSLTTILGLTIVFCFFGCQSTAKQHVSQVEAKKQPISTSNEWPLFEHQKAASFIETCKLKHQDASNLFKQLENITSPHQTSLALLDSINQLDIVLDRLAGTSSLTRNVHPNPEVRKAADICQQKLMTLYGEISLSRPIYNKVIAINPQTLSNIDQYYVKDIIEGFELSGVNHSLETRNKIRKINDEMLRIGQQFNINIREDVRTIEVAASELEGLPQDFIDSHPVNNKGKVSLNTNYPDYLPIAQYATSDPLRLRMYTEFRKRGYPQNKAVLKNLLKKRFELAQTLGFDSYAEYITADKMIGSADNASNFINKINLLAKDRSDNDYQALLERLQKIDPSANSVGDWQKTYIENLIKSEVYNVDAQEVREYFSYKKVKKGIFDLVEQMFDVTISHWDAEVWDASVESYQIHDNNKLDPQGNKVLLGHFYLDMHPRDGKYKNAAHFGIQRGVKGIQAPIAALVCNFPGGDGGSDLMEHRQVETFLHEFGHLLHGIFGGNQTRLALSGVSTERDFVEAPSQMLEEWVWDAETLKTFASNSKGELIPDALIDKMKKGRDFGQGIFTRHQMFYASISLNYYNQDPNGLNLDHEMERLQDIYSPFEYVDDTYFYTSFGHLDGYSAVYYTYMWSLVIASDMFSEFKKHGLRSKEVAQRYRKYVLEPGGTKPAAELVKDFLGRPYNFDAFAKQLKVSDK